LQSRSRRHASSDGQSARARDEVPDHQSTLAKAAGGRSDLPFTVHNPIATLRFVNAQPFSSIILAAAAGSSSTNAPAGLNREYLFKLVHDDGLKLVAALVLLVAGALLARWVGKLATNTLIKREMEPPLRMLLVRLIKLLVLLLALLMAIQQLGFQLLPLIAGLGVAGVGVGLAMQGVLSNLVAGLTIIFVKKFRVGEYIEINNVEGQVDTIELFSTTLIHPDLSRVVIPNRKIVGEIIHNYGRIRRADLSVGVGYDTDLNRALDIIRTVLRSNPRVLKDPAPAVGTAALADSSINIAIRPWVALADFGPAQAEINKAIIEQFREAGIQIPFPQREVRILSGTPEPLVA
jgi:small conductance mechanosensitive channel